MTVPAVTLTIAINHTQDQDQLSNMSFIQTTPNRGLKLRPQGQRYYFSTTKHFFREEDIPRLRALVPELVDATVASADDSGTSARQIANSNIRASKVGFIEPTDSSAWLYKLIGAGIAHHNQTYYDYAIEGVETIQFSEYPTGAGYYKPHLDWGAGTIFGRNDICRKLSFTIQLSKPDSYEGGDLVLHSGRELDAGTRETMREFGCLTVFPSWLLHEVTPVTHGTRRSLVGWVVGPDWL
jgi:PKHD-type hydroxylase